MSYILYNLNFFRDIEFRPFEVCGYRFKPILSKQPRRDLRYHPRKMYLNARVSVPRRQGNSIFCFGVTIDYTRKVKFLEDVLMLISIMIGQNVVPKAQSQRRDFPLCMAKHCKCVANNSDELSDYLRAAIAVVRTEDWRKKFDNGFHVKAFHVLSNTLTLELRFLGSVSIWEYLYYCNHRSKTYKRLTNTTLNTKLNFLVRHYLSKNNLSLPEERLRLFSDMRNQFSHNGRLPIQNPKSPYRTMTFDDCKRHIDLFQDMTQALVLSTMGIDAVEKAIGRFRLDQLLRDGHV